MNQITFSDPKSKFILLFSIIPLPKPSLHFSSIGSTLSLHEEKDVCAAGIQVHGGDYETALDHLQATHADAIGAPKVSGRNICDSIQQKGHLVYF